MQIILLPFLKEKKESFGFLFVLNNLICFKFICED